MPTIADQTPDDRISEARIAQYLRTAMEFLAERGGSARKSEVIEALRSRLSLSKYELELNQSGVERWHVWFIFQLIAFQKAGYFARGGGTWRLLDAGRKALATMSAQEMFDVAREKYAEWDRTRPDNDDADSSEDAGDGAAFTVSRRVWLIGTGANAEHWDRFRSEGSVRIGFSYGGQHLGDLAALSREQIYARIREVSGAANPKNGLHACWQFSRQIRENDTVIARSGFGRILGVGTVTGPYRYEHDQPDYAHMLPVRWIDTAERRLPDKVMMPTKTLTEITKEPGYVEALLGQRTQAAVDFLGSRGCDQGEIDRYFASAPTSVPAPEAPAAGEHPATSPRSLFSETFPGRFLAREELNAMVEELDRKKALILQGPPGTGKTFIATALAEHFAEDPRRVTRVQFHPAYSYEDFVRGIRPSRDHFEAVDGPLVTAARQAMQDSRRHVLLIDEFNRGNVARILGESLSLLEADKRDRRYAVRLGLSGDPLPGGEPHELWLPPNLYILATMNTADRSIALVDHALRRRFSFIDLKPAFEGRAFEDDLVDRFDGDASEQDAREIAELRSAAASTATAMRDINRAIAAERSLGESHCLGHSYFCSDPGNRDIRDWARRIFDREIAPQLREYCADHRGLLERLLSLIPDLAR
jgi:5-methylcytosine-specific restriction protein B